MINKPSYLILTLEGNSECHQCFVQEHHKGITGDGEPSSFDNVGVHQRLYFECNRA